MSNRPAPAKVTPEEAAKQDKAEDLDKLENGPVNDEERGCTDILCCLLFIGANGFLIYLFIAGLMNGKPSYLIAVYDGSGKACGVDLPDYPYLFFPQPYSSQLLYANTCVDGCPTQDSSNKIAAPKCNTQNNVNVTSCVESCSVFTLTGTTFTIPTSWSGIYCLYDTSVLLERVCVPTTKALAIFGSESSSISSGFSQSTDVSTYQQWFNDIKESWQLLLIAIGAAFGLGLVYMLFTRIFAGIIVWIFVLAYFAGIGYLGYYIYNKQQKEQDCLDASGTDPGYYSDGTMCTKTDQQTYLYTAYTIWGIAGASLIGLFCMFKSLSLAIAVLKTATRYVIDVPLAMLVPPIIAILSIGWFAFWAVGFVYIYSWGTWSKRDSSVFGQVTHTDEVFYYLWIFLGIGIWTLCFIQALNQFVLASSACIWYFSQGEGEGLHRPISRSLYRAFRYHLGSIAFGSFILALIIFIRIVLEYITYQAKQSGADKNKCVQYLLACLRCYAECFQRCIEFLNKNAYIQVALSGRNFCSAAKEAVRILWANPGRVLLVNGLGGAFIFIGKLFIIIASVILIYELAINVSPWKENISNPFLPCILVAFVAYAVADIFMTVYGMAIDSILMCFLYDEEIQRGRGNVAPKHCPPLLKEFFDDNDEKN